MIDVNEIVKQLQVGGECCPHCGSALSDDMTPPVAGDGWLTVNGDSQKILRKLLESGLSGQVDAIITDPPYGTGSNTVAGRLMSSQQKYSRSKNPLPAIDGDSLLPEVWQEMMRTVSALCFQLAKPGANMIMFCDWRSYPSFLTVASRTGWEPRGLLVWDKGRGARPNKNGFRGQGELMLWARKPGGTLERGEPVYLDGVFKCPSPPRKHHLTEKPVALMRELAEICPPGGIVLDPFQGSGTTGVAALMSGRRYIGIESVEEYHRIACERLKGAADELTGAKAERADGFEQNGTRAEFNEGASNETQAAV